MAADSTAATVRCASPILKSLSPQPRAPATSARPASRNAGSPRRRADQRVFGRRDAPRLGGDPAESHSSRSDLAADRVDNRRDGNHRKSVGGAVADLAINLHPLQRRRQRHRGNDLSRLQNSLDLRRSIRAADAVRRSESLPPCRPAGSSPPSRPAPASRPPCRRDATAMQSPLAPTIA